MQDLLLLLVMGAVFTYGYFMMDRLDRFLKELHLEEAISEERTEAEISTPERVEKSCLLCYNTSCGKRARHPALHAGEE